MKSFSLGALFVPILFLVSSSYILLHENKFYQAFNPVVPASIVTEQPPPYPGQGAVEEDTRLVLCIYGFYWHCPLSICMLDESHEKSKQKFTGAECFPFFRSTASSTDDFTWKDICCCWLVSISAFNILKLFHLDNSRWVQKRISQYSFSLSKDRKRPANWDPNFMQHYSNAQIVSKPFKYHCVDICCLLIFYSIKPRRFSKIKIIFYSSPVSKWKITNQKEVS